MEYLIDRSRLVNERLVTVRLSGPADPRAICAVMDELLAIGASAPSLRVVVDESRLEPASQSSRLRR